jgi:hypothetical protein
MSDQSVAVIFAVFTSIILSYIQIALDSKVSNPNSYFTFPMAGYLFVMGFGIMLSTFLAVGIVDQLDPTVAAGEKIVLKGPAWIWYAAVGVFGFEVIIQKLNVTLFDKGILSINDWITKSKATAVASTLQREATLTTDAEQGLAKDLYETLNGEQLHTHLLTILGNEIYTNALASIQQQGQINKELYLATLASGQAPQKVKGLIKTYKK